MNELEKIFNEKKTENGDKSYKSTGDNLTDLFFMTPYFEKNLDEVNIGTTEKEKNRQYKMRIEQLENEITARIEDVNKNFISKEKINNKINEIEEHINFENTEMEDYAIAVLKALLKEKNL